jgi:hypothetical protein
VNTEERGFEPPKDDAVEHFWNAAHEFLQAMRALVEAADEFVASQRHRMRDAGRDARVHRIDIDLDMDGDTDDDADAGVR